MILLAVAPYAARDAELVFPLFQSIIRLGESDCALK